MTTPLPLPPVTQPFQLPFHYGALHQIGIDWLVDPGPAHVLLAKHHPALTAAAFEDGQALVSLNYQLYFAQYAFGGGITQEIEFNIIAFPTDESGRLPRLTYAQYAQGWDQTKLLGIARVHVVCDNPFAIRAGQELYAEPKYPGWFEVDLPSLNGPAGETWTVRCKTATIGPDDTLEMDPSPLLDLTAELAGVTPITANSAPITGYGRSRGTAARRPHERVPALPLVRPGRPRTLRPHPPCGPRPGRRPRPRHPRPPRRRNTGRRRLDVPVSPGRRPQPPVLPADAAASLTAALRDVSARAEYRAHPPPRRRGGRRRERLRAN
ncbi:hypothetical protein [Streptomyces decoyicus]